ncbi:MAG: hypothetical protein AAF636_11595 [Pseudomonadota bacterium]
MIPFEDGACRLGEGAPWHSLGQQSFCFDILEQKALSQEHGRPCERVFDTNGFLWQPLSRASEARVYAHDSSLKHRIPVPGLLVTCRAFCEEDIGTLSVTSARKALPNDEIEHTYTHVWICTRNDLADRLPETQVLP